MSRYERQTRFAPFGEEGSAKAILLSNTYFGAGALGSHIVDQLARMGAHHIAIVDMDIVEISNLHRQTLFDEEDAHTLISKLKQSSIRLIKLI